MGNGEPPRVRFPLIADVSPTVKHASMTQTPKKPRNRLVDFYVEDATDRLRFQQEFSVAGFKTLILINGGAVIALLTYAGNAKGTVEAASLQWSFGGYIVGLVTAVLAYLAAYAGQAHLMRHSASAALAEMGAQELDQGVQDRRERRSNLCIGFAIALCVLSLLGFVVGSVGALRGLA